MTIHDERWTLGVAENGDVRLRDVKTGGALLFAGRRALYDALGVLADWRDAEPYISPERIAKATGQPTTEVRWMGSAEMGTLPKCAHPNHPHFPDNCMFPKGDRG